MIKNDTECKALENYLLEWGTKLPVDTRNAILDQLNEWKKRMPSKN